MDELEKALEEIVRNFLLHETGTVETAKNEVQRDTDGIDKENVLRRPPEIPIPGDDFISDLYQCLADQGVLREVHALLRRRLVEILKGSYPLVVSSGCDDTLSVIAIRLFEDFLCCHNLLFTYSVLASEADGKKLRHKFEKMSSAEAESLLEDIHIQKDSPVSMKILRQYSEKQRCSLLECIIGVTSWGDGHNLSSFPRAKSDCDSDQVPLFASASHQEKSTDLELSHRFTSQQLPNMYGADERYLQLQILMEKDKEAQIKIALQRFREEEAARIRDEIATKLKFDFIAKEKELLRNYDERVTHMKNILDREKEVWAAEKARKERELFSQKQDLIKLMEHVKQKKNKLQQALENLKSSNQNPMSPAEPSNKTADSSAASEASSSSDSNRKFNLMKNIELEAIIKRLQTENAILNAKAAKQSRSGWARRETRSPVSEHDYYESPKMATAQDDKIALLQYTVEKQTEELENLKKQLRSGIPQCRSRLEVSESADKVSSTPDQDLEKFLTESKRRFAEIEKQAEQIGSSLKEVFKRNSAIKLSNPTNSLLPHEPTVPIAPKIPSIIKQSSTSHASHVALATKVLGTGLSTSAETLKTFLLDQKEEALSSKLKLSEFSHTRLLKELDSRTVALTSAQQVIGSIPAVVTAPSQTGNKLVDSAASLSTTKREISILKSLTNRPTLPLASLPSSLPKEKSEKTTEEISSFLAPKFTATNAIEQIPQESASTPVVVVKSPQKPPSIERVQAAATIQRQSSSPSPVQKDLLINPESPPSEQHGEQLYVSTEPAPVPVTPDSRSPPLSSSVPFPLPSQKSVPVISAPDKDVHVAPTVVTASSSGALAQYKVPTPSGFAVEALTSSKVPPGGGDTVSGGDAMTKTKVPHFGKQKGSSSDNSISFPDISHAEGDTFEFMTEEDFWAI